LFHSNSAFSEFSQVLSVDSPNESSGQDMYSEYLSLDQIALLYRYIAFFSLRGIAEWAMASGKLFAEGAGPKEAAEVERPMVEQLGMLKGMDKPGAWTSGLNWYR
jgi:hypothetical protein